ncbi:ABC transporter permease [Propylenella binzhouense]|uniref:Iron ABC transporter permease n=1 Tax=Propylenella binzhouense TaxID=2555902 RepID=A0A964T901_9HYPH|nr:iron ABC transporter permease [Propylenella binzhouense]MYZ50087.1 iron ABC transporter permease [Propylenella binzhouense]
MTAGNGPVGAEAGRGRMRAAAFRRTDLRPLAVAALVWAVMAVPLVALLAIAASAVGATWPHLLRSVLPGATVTTLLLMAGVGLLTAVTGVGTAWLVAVCRFPGRRALEWALVLPLAIPTYLVAFAYMEIFDYTGPVQGAVRALFGFHTAREYWFPEIRSLPGAIFAMSAVLYPYVYLTTRILFLMQSARVMEVARTLGATPWRLFLRIALPMARPAIAVGVSLALMETINDIGAVDFFGVRTLTFAVYHTWLNRADLAGAAQLALVLLLLVLLLIYAERSARGRQRFHAAFGGQEPAPTFVLEGWRAFGAAAACFVPVAIGFLMPAALLADYATRRMEQFLDPAILDAALHSVTLAAATAVATVLVAFALAYAARLSRLGAVGLFARLAATGYAVPGTVLAVGILIPMAALDNRIDAAARALFGVSTGLLVTGSGAAIVYACSVRFLAIAYGSLDAGFTKISRHLDMVARTFGRRPGRILAEIHLPLMRRAMTAAALLVFVDTMKELSATVLLRPFDFETLATLVYGAVARGAFEDAAPAALVIVAIGVLPLVLLLGSGLEGAAGSGRRSGDQADRSSGMSR